MTKKEILNEESNKSIDFFSNHLEQLRKQRISISSLIEKLSLESKKVNLTNFENLNVFLKLSSLVTISHLDLIVAIKQMNIVESAWEKIFFIKNIYLTIHETLITYKSYQKFLFDFSVSRSPELRNELNLVKNHLKDFRKKYDESEINEIRNKVSGHICEDFDLYYDTIVKFDGEHSTQMCIDFLKVIQSFQNLSNSFLQYQDSELKRENEEFDKMFKMFVKIGEELKTGKVKTETLDSFHDLLKMREEFKKD